MTPRTPTVPVDRYDRILRAVMWMDAFLSVALVVVGVIVSPVVAALGVPHRMYFPLALASIVCAVLLAAFGAITAVLLMLRMRSGLYFLPNALRLPLPAPMRPSRASLCRTGRSGGVGLAADFCQERAHPGSSRYPAA